MFLVNTQENKGLEISVKQTKEIQHLIANILLADDIKAEIRREGFDLNNPQTALMGLQLNTLDHNALILPISYDKKKNCFYFVKDNNPAFNNLDNLFFFALSMVDRLDEDVESAKNTFLDQLNDLQKDGKLPFKLEINRFHKDVKKDSMDGFVSEKWILDSTIDKDFVLGSILKPKTTLGKEFNLHSDWHYSDFGNQFALVEAKSNGNVKDYVDNITQSGQADSSIDEFFSVITNDTFGHSVIDKQDGKVIINLSPLEQKVLEWVDFAEKEQKVKKQVDFVLIDPQDNHQKITSMKQFEKNVRDLEPGFDYLTDAIGYKKNIILMAAQETPDIAFLAMVKTPNQKAPAIAGVSNAHFREDYIGHTAKEQAIMLARDLCGSVWGITFNNLNHGIDVNKKTIEDCLYLLHFTDKIVRTFSELKKWSEVEGNRDVYTEAKLNFLTSLNYLDITPEEKAAVKSWLKEAPWMTITYANLLVDRMKSLPDQEKIEEQKKVLLSFVE